MATQTDLDRLQIAWKKIQALVNTNAPDASARMAAVRSKIARTSDTGPGR